MKLQKIIQEINERNLPKEEAIKLINEEIIKYNNKNEDDRFKKD